jgi:hypothetical protein
MHAQPETLTATTRETSLPVHQGPRPALLESVYELILAREPAPRGLHVEPPKPVPSTFGGLHSAEGFRSVEQLGPVHYKQLPTNSGLLNLFPNLLPKLEAARLKAGIRRMSDGHLE